MRVLYVHDRPSGGAGESLLQTIACMKPHQKAIVLFGGDGFLRDRFEIQSKEDSPTYKNAHSWLARKWQKSFLLSFSWRLMVLPMHLPFLFEITRLARKYRVDLIHTNTIELMEGALAAKILGLAHIWHVRELVDAEYYQYTLPKQIVARFVSVFSDVILCNSRRTVSGLRSLGADTGKLVTLHNIVDPPATKRDMHEFLNLPKDIRLVGILGWIRSIKRVEDFVDLASGLADLGDSVRFVIIGDWGGDVAYNLMIKSMIERSANAQNIIMTGQLQNAPDYLGSLSVLVCPCGIESFGRSVAEAMAAGVPAVGVKDTGIAEIIDHGETGYLVPEGDVDGMDSFLRDLLANDEKRRRFGLLGMERVKERFGSKRIGSQIKEVYERCLVNRAEGKPSSAQQNDTAS